MIDYALGTSFLPKFEFYFPYLCYRFKLQLQSQYIVLVCFAIQSNA